VNVEGKLRFPECRNVKLGSPIDWPLGDAFAVVEEN